MRLKNHKSSLTLRPPDDWTPEERTRYLTTVGNKRWRLEYLYKIRDKARKTVNLVFNPLQDLYWKSRTSRDFILKARKIGFSTFCLLDDLDDTIANENFTAFIMAHRKEDVQKLFQIIHFAYDHMPGEFKPVADYYNKNELFFKDRNSRIYVGMEARSDLVNKLHVSEFAFLEDTQKKIAASFEAVPAEGSIVLETTPNGVGGYAYELYQEAAGYKEPEEGGVCEFKAHFFPWFKHPEYRMPLTHAEKEQVKADTFLNADEYAFKMAHGLTDEQMKWRKVKKARLHEEFDEQYPEDDISCFMGSGVNYFDMKALRSQMVLS